MIEFEKEHNVSLEDIFKEKNNFETAINYELQLDEVRIIRLTPIVYASLIISTLIFFYDFIIYSNNFALAFFTSFFSFAFIFFTIGTIVLFLSLFGAYPYDLLNKKQINLLNNQFIAEHGIVPDFHEERKKYYSYLTSSEVRSFLINELNNSLSMANHYQIKNKHISKLNKLKDKYLSFNLSSDNENDFINLNNKILNKINKVNQTIQQILGSHINMNSKNHEQKLLSISNQYKGIL